MSLAGSLRVYWGQKFSSRRASSPFFALAQTLPAASALDSDERRRRQQSLRDSVAVPTLKPQ